MQWIRQYQSFMKDPVRLVQWFMICRQSGIILSSIVMARALPIEDVGMMEMLMLCGYLMSFFWSDALLKGYLASGLSSKDGATASTFFWLFVLGSIGAMGILILGQSWLLPLFVDRPALDGLQVFVLYQLFIIPVWMVPFIGLLKGQNPVLLSFYVLVGPAFAIWFGVSAIPDINGALIGLLSYAMVGFVWVLTQTRFLKQLALRSLFLKIWPATWPLVMYAISTGVARSFDAWLVARHFDDADFAVFRYGAREFPLVVAFAAGLSTIMIPMLKSNAALPELRHRSTRLMHSLYPLIACLIILSPPAFLFFFGPDFQKSAYIFNIYLLLSLTQLVFPQSVLTSRGDTRLLWYISLAELAVNMLASLLLMPYLGLAGIAWGTCIAFAFEKIVLMAVCRMRYGIRLSDLIQVPIWIGYALLLMVMFILSAWMFGT